VVVQFEKRCVSGHAFRDCGKSRSAVRQCTSAAKAGLILRQLTARLKPCPPENPIETEFFPQPSEAVPFQNKIKSEFFRKLFRHAKEQPWTGFSAVSVAGTPAAQAACVSRHFVAPLKRCPDTNR